MDNIHIVIYFEEIQSTTTQPPNSDEQINIIKTYQRSTDLIYKKIIKNLGHVIIGTNSVIKSVKNNDMLKTAQVTLHKTVKSLNYVYNLYDYLSLPSDILQLKNTSFSLQTLIDDLKSIYQSVLINSNINFSIECRESINSPESFTLNTDKRRVIQSLINIINLALRSISKNNIYLATSICKRDINVKNNNPPQNLYVKNQSNEQNTSQEFLKVIFSKSKKRYSDCLKVSIKDSGLFNNIKNIQEQLSKNTSNNHCQLNMSKISYTVTQRIINKIGTSDLITCKSVKQLYNKTIFYIKIDNNDSLKNTIVCPEMIESKLDSEDTGFKLSQRCPTNFNQIELTTENDDHQQYQHDETPSQKDINNQRVNVMLKGRGSVESESTISFPNEQAGLSKSQINSIFVPKSNFQNSFARSISISPTMNKREVSKPVQFAISPMIAEEMPTQGKCGHLFKRLNKEGIYSLDKLGSEQNESHMKFNERDNSYNQMSSFTDYRDGMQMTINDNNMTYNTNHMIQDTTLASKQVDSTNQHILQFQDSYLQKNQ